MRKFRGKDNINTLLNIDNVFGEYEGRVLPIVIFISIAVVPLLVWLFFLQGTFIKLWYVIVFTLLWAGRWALIILGKEKEKINFYLEQRQDKGATADEIIHSKHIMPDGLITYDSGKVAYIISGYLKSYLTDDKLSVELENFMNELDLWEWDYYLHSAIDEIKCEDSLPNLKRYTDKEVIQDRIGFYAHQDEWASTHAGLYRMSFLVSTSSVNFKKLRMNLEELVSSDTALCFNEVKILDYEEVIDMMSRDVVSFIDMRTMLLRKFENDNFYGSQVMWYDDKVPTELKPEEESINMEERRQS